MDHTQVRQVVAGVNRRFPEEDQRGMCDLPLGGFQFGAVLNPSLLRKTPVSGSAYGSSDTYASRYRDTVLR